MDIKIIKEEMMNYLDIHGGECANMSVKVFVDVGLAPRVQRNLVMHAIIECFNKNWEHGKVEELTELVADALDQLEAI